MKSHWCEFFLVIAVILAVSCQGEEPSLQRYYVDHQDTENFISLDVPASLFINNIDGMSEELRSQLQVIRKANLLALPLNGENTEQYQKEKQNVLKILDSDRYDMLVKMKYSGMSLQLHALEKKKGIDEFVLMGYSDKNGFVVARLLGKDMNSETLASFIEALKNEEIEIKTDSVEDIFKNI